MPEQAARFADLLRALDRHGVDYVLVGAVAAVLQSAPIATFDIDIVHHRDPANVARLTAALRTIHAYYWEHEDTRPEPEERTLRLAGHHLLRTDFGHIDVYGEIANERDYAALLGQSTVVAVAPDLRVRVLDLEAVIETERAAGRPKDIAALPVLLATLAESRGAPTPQPDGPGD